MYLPGDPATSPVRADRRLPTDVPFTAAQADSQGVGRRVLGRLTRQGLLRRMVRGVYIDACVPDSLPVRAKALSLVVPDSAIVTDRTAAWLHGVDLLAPGDHLLLPPVAIFQQPGHTRVRTACSSGGERTLSAHDIIEVAGIPVTTPLRTALDLGRLLRRDHAIGALDALLRLGEFTHPMLLSEIERFKGFRGVVQLRALAPLADARAESPAESVLRLRWLDAGLPAPDVQIAIIDRYGRELYRVDLGVKQRRYAAEYDGVEFHSSPEQRHHDQLRRSWMRSEQGWVVDVFTRRDVYGPNQQVGPMLARGLARARW